MAVTPCQLGAQPTPGNPATPAPAAPSAADLEALNNALKKAAVAADPSLAPVFERNPTYQPLRGAPAPRAGGPGAPRAGGAPAAPQPLVFLPEEQRPQGAKYNGPLDPAYVAWSKANPVTAPKQMEKLGRGVVAMPFEQGKVWVGWRLLGTDPDDIAFNVYRAAGAGAPVKLNEAPLKDVTFFVDEKFDPAQDNAYSVRPVLAGREGEPSKDYANKVPANSGLRNYVEVPIQLPQTDTRYSIADISPGDLDGDGEFELVVKSWQNPQDNSFTGFTGDTILQGYELDGTLLWTIHTGNNIREGEHYLQFMVYDLDGDGRAELAMKTADGTIDGTGKVLGDPNAKWVRDDGKIQDGPEYFTIFDGRTGQALATKEYLPTRYPTNSWGGIGGNGGNDNGGNRNDRFLAAVAYLDGERPSVVMCRGYYGRSALVAWDWRNGELTQRWIYDTLNGDNPFSGQGGHQLSVGDVDADGRDEIIYHSMIVDDNGKPLYSTGYRHGDALHVGVFDPTRPTAIQVMTVHENENESGRNTSQYGSPGIAVWEAADGKLLWRDLDGIDIERGVAADIDPRRPGYEVWNSRTGLRTWQGERYGNSPAASSFLAWWDGDLLRETVDGGRVSKWNWETGTAEVLLAPGGAGGRGAAGAPAAARGGRGASGAEAGTPPARGEAPAGGAVATGGGALRGGGARGGGFTAGASKGTPNLGGDILGDWREEIILRSPNAIRIYSTTIPTNYRIFTLAHDPMYRVALAWQNTAYNQPPHPGFYLGAETKFPVAKPNIKVVEPKP